MHNPLLPPHPPIDWEKVLARAWKIIPNRAAASDIVRLVRRDCEAMSEWEWQDIPDAQELAEDMAHTVAARRLTDTLESQQLQGYVFNKTRNYQSVAQIIEVVTYRLNRMSSMAWENIGPDRKAYLLEAIDNAIQVWMEQQRRHSAAFRSQDDNANHVWHDLLGILERLPPLVRAAFTLYKFRRYSIEKISEELNLSREDVRRYLALAADAFSKRR